MGRAVYARQMAHFCLELLAKMEDDEKFAKPDDLFDPRQSIWYELLSSAWVIDASLEELSEPQRKRAVGYLTTISDYLHKTVPKMMMDESTYESRRAAMIKEAKDLRMSDEFIKVQLDSSKWFFETVQMLKKYRSAPPKESEPE